MPFALDLADCNVIQGGRRNYYGGMNLTSLDDIAQREFSGNTSGCKYKLLKIESATFDERGDALIEKTMYLVNVAKVKVIISTHYSRLRHLAKQVDESTPVWIKNLSNQNGKYDLRTAAKTIESLLDFLDASGLGAVDSQLRKIDVEHSNPYHAVSVLRSLYFKRNEVPYWAEFSRKVWSKLEKTNPEDFEDIMFGLNVDA